jgi:hypothetical protein
MAGLHFEPVQDGCGNWHAAYRVPGTETMNSTQECLSEDIAIRVCRDENARQRHLLKTSIANMAEPEYRRIPHGFYTDNDAS